jgi:hypothetical protein
MSEALSLLTQQRKRALRARPIASAVLIMGLPCIGGSLRGTYDYQSSLPEAGSVYRWYLNAEEIVGTQDFKLLSEHAGALLEFSVAPRALNGELGDEYFSPPVRVTSGFQGISVEENENSYLKQQGNFSFHVPEPDDRILVSTGGAFAVLDGATGTTCIEGENDWGANVPEHIRNLLINNPGVLAFATERDFAILVNILGTSANQLLVWGQNIPSDLPRLHNIKSVYTNRSVIVYEFRNPSGHSNRIGAIGRAIDPAAQIPAEIQLALIADPLAAIYATETAFAVRTQAGKVYAWGNIHHGGSISPQVRAVLNTMTVERIICGPRAFCAIGTGGEVVAWGSAGDGGTIPVDQLTAIIDDGGALSVIAAEQAFVAITRNRRRAYSWGAPGSGGAMSASAAELARRGDIVLCKANRWAFTIANASGQVEAWGATQYGGASLSKEQSQRVASLFARYPVNRHANSGVGSRVITIDGAITIAANDVSFFLYALDEIGLTLEALAWGYPSHGGNLPGPTEQVLRASLIRDVYCTNGAYGVIVDQGAVRGAVLVWGATLAMEDAGEIPPELVRYLNDSVVELYSIKRYPYVEQSPPPLPPPIDPSFAARRSDGTYVLWGGNVDNQFYDPANPALRGTVKITPRPLEEDE